MKKQMEDLKDLSPNCQKLWHFYNNKANWRLMPPTYKQMRDHLEVKSDNAINKMLKQLNIK